MSRFIDHIRQNISYDVISDTEIRNLFSGSDDRRYALVKRAILSGELIHLRRGLYLVGEKYSKMPLNKYAIAQNVYGPSYISFESALSYHELIPEEVFTTTSACIKRSKDFDTPIGKFSYVKIPSRIFYIGVDRKEVSEQVFFMATPWKAIADYVYAHKKDWVGIAPLIQSLRIDEESLYNLDKSDLDKLEFYYDNKRVQKFISTVKRDLIL